MEGGNWLTYPEILEEWIVRDFEPLNPTEFTEDTEKPSKQRLIAPVKKKGKKGEKKEKMTGKFDNVVRKGV